MSCRSTWAKALCNTEWISVLFSKYPNMYRNRSLFRVNIKTNEQNFVSYYEKYLCFFIECFMTWKNHWRGFILWGVIHWFLSFSSLQSWIDFEWNMCCRSLIPSLVNCSPMLITIIMVKKTLPVFKCIDSYCCCGQTSKRTRFWTWSIDFAQWGLLTIDWNNGWTLLGCWNDWSMSG